MATHLHFDCFSGISGDMTLGALIDAGLPLKDLVDSLKGLRLKGYELRSKKVLRGGLQATKAEVYIRDGFRSPLSPSHIHSLIASSDLPGPVKDLSQAAFDRLAQAEGTAHRVKPKDVRFHEVGVLDSLVDVVGCTIGCHLLGVTQVTASPVNLGSGFLDSSHGRLPVPGPAVAVLAKGIPVYSAGPERELTTPTGLALLGTLSREFGPLPLIRPRSIGYGAGSADPQGWPNALRIFLGESDTGSQDLGEVVVQIETNLDDLQPQAYESVTDRVFACGALDVTLTPVIMKRGRPGIVLSALAPREKAEAVAHTILKETTALGVRMQEVRRRVLPRVIHTLRTARGDVRVKVADVEPGIVKAAPEYSDCKRIADQTGKPVREIMEEVMHAFRKQGKSKKEKSRDRRRGQIG